VRAALVYWRAQGLQGLALDDLHHADPSSLTLLLPLMGSAEDTRLPWLLATRPPAPAHGLGELPRLSLQALTLHEVQLLLASLGLAGLRHEEWAPVLLQRSGGNPLYLLQTLTAAFEADALGKDTPPAQLATPASLSALLVQRLEKLSPDARAIARLASVAGSDFTLQLACLLLQRTPAALADPWLELQTAQVMREAGFAHDLIRDACGLITPAEVRSLMHAQVAQALQDRQAPDARVAEHWDAAGRWPEAALAYERAADHAHARNAVADELLKLQAASRCHRASGQAQSQSAAFATELRALHLRVANQQLGEDTLQACEDLLAEAHSDEQRAAAQVQLAYYWAERFEPERALPWAQAAMEQATRCGAQRVALLAAQRLGGALSRLGRHEEALLCLRPLSNNLQVLTRDERLNWLSDFGSALDYADHRSEALQVFESVVEEALPNGRLSVAASAVALTSNVLAYLGRTQDSLRAAEQALVLHRRSGLEGDSLLVDESNQLGTLRDLGHFSAYLARAEQLPDAMRAAGSPFWAANTEHDLATAYAWLGRADLALRTLSAQALDQLSPMMQVARLVTRARLQRDFGVGGGSTSGTSPQALLLQAQALLGTVQASGRSHFSLSLSLQLARDEEPDRALATAAHLETEGLRRENLMLACSASGVRLRLLMAAGDAEGASAVATRLLQRLEPFGPPPGIYAPELWWLAHQALRASEPAAAQAALIQAVQWIRQRARDHVPEHHRESFLARNPINRAVLAAAQGLGL
jgi:tetratricopeptide (TPR) repeat protein